jgi:hypothetical protein
MTAFKMVLAGGAAVAALVSAAPAAAQYYPNYGYNNGGNVVGQVIQQVLGGGQYAYGGGYGGNSQYAVSQCARAVENRVNRDYGYRASAYGYGGYNGYPQQGGARVVGITSVEPRSSGRLRVRGIVSANAYAGNYNNGYGGYGGYAQPRGDLTFKCNIDYRGYISDIDLERNNYAYGNYGYRR